MPLLRKASRITVLTVTDEKDLPEDDPGARLASGLQARGLSADAHAVLSGGGDIAVTLQENAIQLGAALLVMGGYGHSRIRELVLGGVTREILATMTVPVLMAH